MRKAWKVKIWRYKVWDRQGRYEPGRSSSVVLVTQPLHSHPDRCLEWLCCRLLIACCWWKISFAAVYFIPPFPPLLGLLERRIELCFSFLACTRFVLFCSFSDGLGFYVFVLASTILTSRRLYVSLTTFKIPVYCMCLQYGYYSYLSDSKVFWAEELLARHHYYSL